MWTCASMSPGTTVRPRRSMTRVAARGAAARSPTAAMRPLRIVTRARHGVARVHRVDAAVDEHQIVRRLDRRPLRRCLLRPGQADGGPAASAAPAPAAVAMKRRREGTRLPATSSRRRRSARWTSAARRLAPRSPCTSPESSRTAATSSTVLPAFLRGLHVGAKSLLNCAYSLQIGRRHHRAVAGDDRCRRCFDRRAAFASVVADLHAAAAVVRRRAAGCSCPRRCRRRA